MIITSKLFVTLLAFISIQAIAGFGNTKPGIGIIHNKLQQREKDRLGFLFEIKSLNFNSPTNRISLIRKSAMNTAINDGDESNQVDLNLKGKDVFRILCLHGKGNCAESFRSTLMPLEDALAKSNVKFEFDYLTAPFRIASNDGSACQWWTLKPGERSFNAKEYGGFEESAQLVKTALQEATMKQKEYDFILGHSQGAILLSALISTHAISDAPPPLGYILNGCAWPNPYMESLEAYTYKDTYTQGQSNIQDAHEQKKAKPKILFVIGENDKINPPEGALRVKDALERGGLPIDVCNHEGGHAVPVTNEVALIEMVNWIKQKAFEGSTHSS